ncbi:GIY-YIG nuclease family protein [Cyanobacterium stanieri LEGE 03274]|uniref:GIY-YIG nuclease family protein n=1 Tax=Cyanobacterium stanieri LEGE 03274 TaxID=1828756 RepID=A0ABR9V5U5_9CHRO|nr:GIY-YIG nuclease family protein [Cyanobacterium stanieri]MBE9223262.1 GIY-YIG nuclease family protein [Cyanobacterium stanieri LEGE 03274]
MTINPEKVTLNDLDYLPYLNEKGDINDELGGKIGVYAIFDNGKKLEYVGYSRNLLLSLKQHLIRQPQRCYWLKCYLITRPSRSILTDIKQRWLEENGSIPLGNEGEEYLWSQPIDAKNTMTEEDIQQYNSLDELGKIKLLKKVARRYEEVIKKELDKRGVTFEVRFNPKLKEEGLLDLKI